MSSSYIIIKLLLGKVYTRFGKSVHGCQPPQDFTSAGKRGNAAIFGGFEKFDFKQIRARARHVTSSRRVSTQNALPLTSVEHQYN